MCSIYVYFLIFIMILGYVCVQGMSSVCVVVLFFVNGGVMIFVRFVVGLFVDFEIIQKRNIIGIFFIFGGVFFIFLLWFMGYYFLLVYLII